MTAEINVVAVKIAEPRGSTGPIELEGQGRVYSSMFNIFAKKMRVKVSIISEPKNLADIKEIIKNHLKYVTAFDIHFKD